LLMVCAWFQSSIVVVGASVAECRHRRWPAALHSARRRCCRGTPHTPCQTPQAPTQVTTHLSVAGVGQQHALTHAHVLLLHLLQHRPPLRLPAVLLSAGSPRAALSSGVPRAAAAQCLPALWRPRFRGSQAEWCRDGREKHDRVIRCAGGRSEPSCTPVGGKSHTASTAHASECISEHVLTSYLLSR
jgi:hypothetical protein